MPNLGLLFPKGTWSIIHCVITLNESVKICYFKVNYPGVYNCDISIVLEMRVSEEKCVSKQGVVYTAIISVQEPHIRDTERVPTNLKCRLSRPMKERDLVESY